MHGPVFCIHTLSVFCLHMYEYVVQQLWYVCSVFIDHLSSVFMHYLCFVFIHHPSSVLKQNICSLYTHRLCFALIQYACLYSHIIRVLYSYNTCTHKLSVFFIHTSYVFCFHTRSLFCITWSVCRQHLCFLFPKHNCSVHLCSAFTRHHFSRIHSQQLVLYSHNTCVLWSHNTYLL
jgi:hypothetical protein